MKPLELRPSAASRWIACPASALLSKDIPPTPSGDAAQAGTAIHALAEYCYQFEDDAMTFEGDSMEGVKFAKWHCEMAASHVDAIKDLEKLAGKRNIRVEEKVSYCESEAVTLRGTADVIALAKDMDCIIVLDLKTGAQYVDEDSDQLKIYALAALNKFNLDIGMVELQINQPRTGGLRVHAMKINELRAWEHETLIPAIVAATDPATQPTPSEKACQYCPAKLTCPAQAAAFELVASQEPGITTMSKDEIKQVMVRLTDQQVSDLLDRAPIVKAFVDSLRKHAKERMEQGGILPGWQLAPKRAMRKWVSEQSAKQALTDAGVPVDKLYTTDFISPAEAEKLLDKEQREILEGLTKKESSGVTIARDASLRQ
jgi:CRISPR/Cas system-associated exonuclease Cas4 (RecB family)